MAMNFDTYNTSFQSLMKPMYNVNANYAMGLGGYPGAAGMYGSGYMNPAMMGMGMYAAGPMAGVSVGQFNASYLLPAEDQMNNYYARPVAAHKKENETGTILGILATALGTAAMLAALAKGKFRRAPKAPKSNAAPRTANNQTSSLATTNNTASNSTGGVKTKNNTTTLSKNTNNTQSASRIAGALPPHNSRRQYALNKLQAASNLPSSGNVIVTPPPALPASGSAATGSSIANLPAVVTKPVQNPVNPSNIATPNVPSVVSQNIKLRPIEEYINHQNQFNIPDKWIKGSLPLHAGTQQAASTTANVKALPKSAEALANEKLIEVRPDLTSQGAVVHTTHTPESIANGYSIASNAKGGDKLAELLVKLQS